MPKNAVIKYSIFSIFCLCSADGACEDVCDIAVPNNEAANKPGLFYQGTLNDSPKEVTKAPPQAATKAPPEEANRPGLFYQGTLSAPQAAAPPGEAITQVMPMHNHKFLIEGKAACFFPTNHRVHHIYSRTMGMYGVEASVQTQKYLYPWFSGSYTYAHGRSTGVHYRTKATLVPLGVGLKFMYNFSSTNVYAGIGALYTHLHMRDHLKYVTQSTSKWSWGGIVKLGFCYFPLKFMFFDVFADYSHMKFDFHNKSKRVKRHDVDFSGFSVGAAIGFAI